MHRLILVEFQKFVEVKLGENRWHDLVEEAGLTSDDLVVGDECPDAHLLTLISTASNALGVPMQSALEAFGEFIVPDLISMFGRMILPQWKTLDLIAHTEHAIHQALREASANINPPSLHCYRPNDGEVLITYTSQRRLCSMAKGIAKGVATHFGERITITEPCCMLQGAPKCEIHVCLVPDPAPTD